MCNWQAGTIVIAKVAGTNEILGGNPILSRVKNKTRALYYYDSNNQKTCDPRFSNCEFFLQSDFTKDKRCLSHYGYVYQL
ncbi:hypothetical protein Glove_195g57 [Diversispora epigaea]|uniref:Uncharacterized protein n=1 Tax=Diversispora epigaea TaxID=1348612 RepID=A0A397IU08_9GLOM|nr:hypothetical protein Glove_195g57 [Diversispora epigaea]